MGRTHIERANKEKPMPVEVASELSAKLTASRARWTARQTPQSLLNDGQKQDLLGVVVDPERLAAVMSQRTAAATAAAAVPNYAPEVDWRDRNGNHVTPVKDQSVCGSCVSFGCAALTESMTSIEKGQLLDLCEADLHFCSSHGPNCSGWWPDNALDEIRMRGLPDEAYFPYETAFTTGDPRCIAGPDRDNRAVRITTSSPIVDVVERKNHLSNVGPCVAVLHIYDDFYLYASGVYQHVDGEDVGLHCVEVIGYSEAEQCWICKNSWGTAWGDSGFFKIAYGEAGIDSEFPFWTVTGVHLPPTRPWKGWESLGGGLSSRPSAVSWGPKRIDVVARGTDSAVWHRWWIGTVWLGWESLRGTTLYAPAICSRGVGSLDVFSVATNHHLYRKWYQGGGWSRWEDLGGMLSSEPSAVAWGPNRMDVFVRGMDMQLLHLWWDGMTWNGWDDLGGVLSSAPAVATWGPGRLDVFYRGRDLGLVHRTWDGDKWSAEEDLGGLLSDAPAAVAPALNRIDTFYPGQRFHLLHRVWDGQRWEDEEDLGGVLGSAFGVSASSSGRMDCFAKGVDSALWHKWSS
jgi:C1A family cysteine protease